MRVVMAWWVRGGCWEGGCRPAGTRTTCCRSSSGRRRRRPVTTSPVRPPRRGLPGPGPGPRRARLGLKSPPLTQRQPTRVEVESSHPVRRNARRPPQLGASGVPQRRLRAERARPGRAAPVARAAASSPAGLESSVSATRPACITRGAIRRAKAVSACVRAGRRNLAYRFNLLRHIGNISTIRRGEQARGGAGGRGRDLF